MQRSMIAILLVALFGAAAASYCSPNGPQLCKDCEAGVAGLADTYGNSVDSLQRECALCTSDLCKTCLTYPVGAFGASNVPKSWFPWCTQNYLKVADNALYGPNGVYSKPGVAGGSTKTLCPYITTSDTLKCWDLGYGSVYYDNYGPFESLCVAANSDLQRRCMWQYTSASGVSTDPLYPYNGLPTTKTAVLKYTIPLCLSLNSEAQYSCLRAEVFKLDANTALITELTTKTVADKCGIAPGITCTQQPR